MSHFHERYCLEHAYEAFVRLPVDNLVRIKSQATMALLRDRIAEITGKTPEEIQNKFETEAVRYVR